MHQLQFSTGRQALNTTIWAIVTGQQVDAYAASRRDEFRHRIEKLKQGVDLANPVPAHPRSAARELPAAPSGKPRRPVGPRLRLGCSGASNGAWCSRCRVPSRRGGNGATCSSTQGEPTASAS